MTEENEIELEMGSSPKIKTKGVISAIIAMCVLGVVCNISIVALFLEFINTQIAHTDTVDSVRIETCHDISEQGAKAMDKMSEALMFQSTEFGIFGNKLDSIHDSVKANELTFKQLLELERRGAARKEY